MPTPDGMTEQVPEVQQAIRQVLQESGAAGTGPLNLPPPADITSTQQRSESSNDPNSYSNTLNVDLYRDADGKVWTQPGPGHDTADIKMRIRRWNGQWHVVTEHRRATRRRKRGDRIITDYETDAMTSSGAPVTETGSVERFEKFSPQDAKQAIRQSIAALQTKGAIYVYDPNVPTPVARSGLVSNGLLAVAVLAAAGAVAALAGVGPFAAAATVAVAPGSSGQIAPPPPVPIVVKALRSTLNAPITLYTVIAEDPGGGELSYSWTMTATSIPDGMCGTPLVPWTRTGNEVPWSHAINPPDRCPHLSTDHPVTTDVTITVLTGRDKGAIAVCTLRGSESQTITSPDATCTHSGGSAGATSPAPGALAITTAPAPPSGNGPWPWAVGLAVLAVATAVGGLTSRSRSAAAQSGVMGSWAGAPPRSSADYAADDPDRELKMRLDGEIEHWGGVLNSLSDTGETRGGDNSVNGGGCLNIFGNLYESFNKRQVGDDMQYRYARPRFDHAVQERASLEGFQPRPVSSEASADDPPDRIRID